MLGKELPALLCGQVPGKVLGIPILMGSQELKSDNNNVDGHEMRSRASGQGPMGTSETPGERSQDP